MKHRKYHTELNAISPNRDIGYIKGKALRGKTAELKSAKEMHALLRDYTYHLISLGNAFRDISRLHGKFEGSMWRSYQGCSGTELKALMERLNSMNPYDVDAVLEVERAIETLAEKLIKKEA